MRALCKTETGVELRSLQPPQPGPGEVVIKVMCAGLCRTDIYVAQGDLSSELPRTLGHECSGVICRLGEGVPQEHLGERVTVFPWSGCQRCEQCLSHNLTGAAKCPQRQFLGWQVDGAFATFLKVKESQCVALPSAVDFQAGAYFEPLLAALGVLVAPWKQAVSPAILGDNRIASLTSIILRDYARCEHKQVVIGEASSDQFDLLIEMSATTESLAEAFRILKPGGVLVVKSRPAQGVEWPVRLQVEKEITALGASYGSPELALLILEKKKHLFTPLWNEPKPLHDWADHFAPEVSGEERKTFFLPQALVGTVA